MSELNEYSVLHNGALFFDRSDRMRIRISGAKAAELVAGMVTNDVSALVPGEGQYAAALTPKGKIVADLRIFALEDGFLIDTSAAAGPGWKEMIRKYINPRVAPYHDVSAELSDIGVFGRSARSVVSKVFDSDDKDLLALPLYGHSRRAFADVTVIIATILRMTAAVSSPLSLSAVWDCPQEEVPAPAAPCVRLEPSPVPGRRFRRDGPMGNARSRWSKTKKAPLFSGAFCRRLRRSTRGVAPLEASRRS